MTARKARVPRRLRQRVARTAGHCCGYCRTPERIAGIRLNIEHIIPESRNGKTVERNLWLACHACNEFKAARIQARDPVTARVFACGTRDRKSGTIIFDGATMARKSSVSRRAVAPPF
jgi:HNH endonuclease